MPLPPTDGAGLDLSLPDTNRAILNILEDFTGERVRQVDTQKAILNILDDFGDEKRRLEDTQRAVLNILDDSGEERARQGMMHRAILNILEDFGGEKERLEATQRAILNILDDFEDEKRKVETMNAELRREVAERAAAEQALRERTDALGRSNAELEQFAYVASHDLQEPLRMVSSYCQLFEKRYAGQVDERGADSTSTYAVDGREAHAGAHRRPARVLAGRPGRRAVSSRCDTSAALDQALANLRSRDRGDRRGGRARGPTARPSPGTPAGSRRCSRTSIGNAIKFRRPDGAPVGSTSLACRAARRNGCSR